MPTKWGERPNSLKHTSNPVTVTRGYKLIGVASEAAAKMLAAGYTPALYVSLYDGILYRQNIACDKVAPTSWNIDVTWGSYDKKEREAGDFSWRFSTGGGTKHVTQAISHVAHYTKDGLGAPGDDNDHKGVIGVNEQGDVEGIDIPDTIFRWNEHHSLLFANYGWTYAKGLESYTNHVNDAPFRGLEAGTVRLDNAEGGQSSKDPLLLEVDFYFEHSPNATGLVVGNIAGINKLGHQYLWVRHKTKSGTENTPKQPDLVSVEQVFYDADFSALGIGS